MARRIRAEAGVRGLDVGDGLILDSGDEAVISDAEFANLSQLVTEGLVTDLGATTDPESVAPGKEPPASSADLEDLTQRVDALEQDGGGGVAPVAYTLLGDSQQMTNQPAADTEFFSSGLALHPMFRIMVVGTGMTQVRWRAYQITAGAATAQMRLQFTTDLTGATGWADLTGSTLPMSPNGWKDTGWVALPEAAQTECLLRIMCIGGDAAADPQVGPSTVLLSP